MEKFDTKVQYLKYSVLREVARAAWDGNLPEKVNAIPKEIIPGKTPTMRCCVYKERAILGERVRLALGGDRHNPNVIEVIDIACEDCPAGGHTVTENCRGCLAHRCADACPRGAITFDERQKAHIDKSKCIECGRCAAACPYGAIANRVRPCENACKIKAISSGEDGSARIDEEKCISCGACVYQCPFGAISDKSYILDAVDFLKKAKSGGPHVYAAVAPAIASQFVYASLGQIVTALRALGFYRVVETALGADMVAAREASELAKKGFLTSSCCPAFVTYVERQFPRLLPYVSENPSPMVAIATYIKQRDPEAKVVFIGPCTAKKAEARRPDVHAYVDCVLTFEELQALFDARDITPETLEESPLEGASYFGRIFAKSGGLTGAVTEGLLEIGSDFTIKPLACDGVEDCRNALLRAAGGKRDFNFIEGMICTGGCVGGAGCLTHGPQNKAGVESYSRAAGDKTIREAVDTAKKK